jgi:hypothetical protein
MQIETGIVPEKSARYRKYEQKYVGGSGAWRGGGISYLLRAGHSLSAAFCLPAGPVHVSRSGVYLALDIQVTHFTINNLYG